MQTSATSAEVLALCRQRLDGAKIVGGDAHLVATHLNHAVRMGIAHQRARLHIRHRGVACDVLGMEVAREDHVHATVAEHASHGGIVVDKILGKNHRLGGEMGHHTMVHHHDNLASSFLGSVGLLADEALRGRLDASARNTDVLVEVVILVLAGVDGYQTQAGSKLRHIAERSRIAGQGLPVAIVGIDGGKI